MSDTEAQDSGAAAAPPAAPAPPVQQPPALGTDLLAQHVTVHITNIPYTTTEESLTELVNGIAPAYKIQLLKRPDGKSKGTAFVDFTNPEDANKIITQFNDYQLEGRPIRVKLSTEDRAPRFQHRRQPFRKQYRDLDKPDENPGRRSYDMDLDDEPPRAGGFGGPRSYNRR